MILGGLISPEKSNVNNESVGIVRLSVGFKVGDTLSVGLVDSVGDVVTVGESLGLNDGARDGSVEGDFDVVGNEERDGCEEGWDDG